LLVDLFGPVLVGLGMILTLTPIFYTGLFVPSSFPHPPSATGGLVMSNLFIFVLF